ncbi:helix-turn-helix domain-containing protein, partial [Pseudomonas sp. SID14000]|uniref:TetR/AcrR family transcriptional regulator n=1 Tax=Pseudomonas sp. SID14000 TaxID=1986221 RepID=UPI00111E1E6F
MSYNASGRREQARARRQAVVLAAKELFERDGFRATTIAAVAKWASVSAESVYKGFGTKATLTDAVFNEVCSAPGPWSGTQPGPPKGSRAPSARESRTTSAAGDRELVATDRVGVQLLASRGDYV